jgi:integrase
MLLSNLSAGYLRAIAPADFQRYSCPVLYKRKDSKYWWYRFVIDGEEHAGSTRTTNKKLAADIEATARTKKLQENAGILPKPVAAVQSLNEFTADFFNKSVFPNIKNRHTRRYYTEAWSRLLDQPIADLPMDQINTLAIDGYKAERNKAVGVYVANSELKIMRKALRQAQRWGLLTQAPEIQLLEGEKARETVISEAELMQIARFCEPTMRAALILAYDTGLRAGEIVQLQWQDVRLEAGIIELDHDEKRVNGLKSDKAERKVPITARLREVLTGMKHGAPTDYVFRRRNGRPLNVTWLSHRFVVARRAAKLPEGMVFHSCRHSFLTRLGRTGIGLFGFMSVAGHASPEMSRKYVHDTTDEDIRRAGALLERTFSGTESVSSS